MDVSGEHAFVAPKQGDIRGQCPGECLHLNEIMIGRLNLSQASMPPPIMAIYRTMAFLPSLRSDLHSIIPDYSD